VITRLPNQILSLTAYEQEGDSGGARRNLRFLKTTFIKDVKLVGQVQDAFDLKFSPPDMKSLRDREEAAIK
jgi:hypothetical protein